MYLTQIPIEPLPTRACQLQDLSKKIILFQIFVSTHLYFYHVQKWKGKKKRKMSSRLSNKTWFGSRSTCYEVGGKQKAISVKHKRKDKKFKK